MFRALCTIIMQFLYICRTVAFELLKKAIEIFVKHKLGLNNKHEFAIITFEKETLWVRIC